MKYLNSWKFSSCVCVFYVFLVNYLLILPVPDPRIWSRGSQKICPRFSRRSEAESCEQSKPTLTRVQGLP